MRLTLTSIISVLVAGCVTSRPKIAVMSGDYSEKGPQNRYLESLNNVKLPEVPNLKAYQQYAAKNNPGLQLKFYRWKVALEKIPQLKSLPDPQFTFGYFIENVETRVGPQEFKLGIRQKFPWFGKLDLKATSAGHRAEALLQDYLVENRALNRKIAENFYQYAYLGQAIKINQKSLELLQKLVKVAGKRYTTGKLQFPDLIKLNIQIELQKERIATLNDLRQPVSTNLRTLLNDGQKELLPFPKHESIAKISLSGRRLSDLEAQIDRHPMLSKFDQLVAGSEAELELAQKNRLPDVMFGLDYIGTGSADMHVDDSGKDPIIAMVTINLPIWQSRLDAAENEQRLKKQSLVKNKAEMRLKMIRALHKKFAVFNENSRKITLYAEKIIPQQQKLFDVVSRLYIDGKADYLKLIDAEQALLKSRLQYEGFLLQVYSAIAVLEELSAD